MNAIDPVAFAQYTTRYGIDPTATSAQSKYLNTQWGNIDTKAKLIVTYAQGYRTAYETGTINPDFFIHAFRYDELKSNPQALAKAQAGIYNILKYWGDPKADVDWTALPMESPDQAQYQMHVASFVMTVHQAGFVNNSPRIVVWDKPGPGAGRGTELNTVINAAQQYYFDIMSPNWGRGKIFDPTKFPAWPSTQP